MTASPMELDAARPLLSKMGIAPADLLAETEEQRTVPTFSEYIPQVSRAVSPSTARSYGSYWRRVEEAWGGRRLDEPSPKPDPDLSNFLDNLGIATFSGIPGFEFVAFQWVSLSIQSCPAVPLLSWCGARCGLPACTPSTADACIQIDGHGDLGVTGTMAGGGSTPGLGAGLGIQGSNADRIKDLNGPFFVGGDFSRGTDSQGRPVYVGEPSGGVGAEGLPLPAEVHGGVSYTWSASFSIPKVSYWLMNLFD